MSTPGLSFAALLLAKTPTPSKQRILDIGESAWSSGIVVHWYINIRYGTVFPKHAAKFFWSEKTLQINKTLDAILLNPPPLVA